MDIAPDFSIVAIVVVMAAGAGLMPVLLVRLFHYVIGR